ncbi:hypothetical protein Tco_0000218 [Tanacetum coccineum]
MVIPTHHEVPVLIHRRISRHSPPLSRHRRRLLPPPSSNLSCTSNQVEGQDVIASLPWDEWWNFELSEDDANPHIALLPLHPMFELNPTRLLHGSMPKA